MNKNFSRLQGHSICFCFIGFLFLFGNVQAVDTSVRVAYTQASLSNLRADRAADAEIIQKLSINTQVDILDKKTDWVSVRVRGNKAYQGWLHQSLLAERPLTLEESLKQYEILPESDPSRLGWIERAAAIEPQNTDVLSELIKTLQMFKEYEKADQLLKSVADLKANRSDSSDGPINSAETAEKSVAFLPFKERGTNWVGMGAVPGLWGKVNSIATYKNRVYVAGAFSSIENPSMKNRDSADGLTTVAVWDGASWTALAQYGNCGDVKALAVDKSGNVYAAGDISCIGNLRGSIGMWNGSEWVPVGDGIWGDIWALAVDQMGNLYATGGSLRLPGGQAIGGFVMKWDGDSWNKLGESILTGFGSSIAINKKGHVFVGGSFDSVGDISARNIASWDGKNWSAIGEGVASNLEESYDEAYVPPGVYSIAFDSNDALYVVAAGDVAKWSGEKWETVNIETNKQVSTLYIDNSDYIYVGLATLCNAGRSVATEFPVQFWNGSRWGSFPPTGGNSGISAGCSSGGSVNHVTQDDSNNLVVGGAFTETASGAVNIAKWTGNNWEIFSKSAGVNDMVTDLVVDNSGSLYVLGNFTRVDDIEVKKNQIAKWDGTQWSVLKKTDMPIQKMYVDVSGNLYIASGPGMAYSNGEAVNNISRWDGTNWLKITEINYVIKDFIVDTQGRIYTWGQYGDEYEVWGSRGVDLWDGKQWSLEINGDEFGFDYRYRIRLGASDRLIAFTSEHSWIWDGEVWTKEPGTPINNSYADWRGYYFGVTRENHNEGRKFITAYHRPTGRSETLGVASRGQIDAMAASQRYLYVGGSFAWFDRTVKPFLVRLDLKPEMD